MPDENEDSHENGSIDRIRFFEESVQNAIDYNRKENRVTYAEAIGSLEIIKARMVREALECEVADDEDEDEKI